MNDHRRQLFLHLIDFVVNRWIAGAVEPGPTSRTDSGPCAVGAAQGASGR